MKINSLLKIIFYHIFIFTLIFVVSAKNIHAAPPSRILLQATVADGEKLLEGRKRVIVRLYSNNTKTDWEEVHKDVLFTYGICSLSLGENVPFEIADFDIATPNIRLIIDGEGEDQPIPLFSMPYAMRAAYAENIPSDISFKDLTITNNMVVGDVDTSQKVFGEKIASLDSTLVVWGDSFIKDKLAVSGNLIVSNNFVGIKKPNPEYDLDVNGTINAKALLINGVVYSSEEGDRKIAGIMQLSTGNNTFLMADGDNWTTVNADSIKSLMSLASNDSVQFAKLAVNTDSPQGVFHVKSTDNALGIKRDTLVVTNNRLGIGIAAPTASLHVSGNYPLHIGSPTTENILVISEDGNIGILTNNPEQGYALHVKGNIKVEGSIATETGLSTDDDWSMKTGVVYNDSTDIRVGIGVSSPSGDFHIQSISRTDYEGDTFVVTKNLVGIGTTTPVAMFHIQQQTDPSAALDQNRLFLVEQNHQESFFTIRQNGKIGLGTSDPTHILHIVQDDSDVLVVTKNGIGIGRDNPSAILDILAPSNPTKDIIKVERDSDLFLLLDENGSLAIGTANPQGALHVYTQGKDALVVSNNGVVIGADTPTALLDIYESSIPTNPYFIIRNSENEYFVVSRNGSVGLNIDDPQGELHVKSKLNSIGSYTDTLVVTNNRIGVGTTAPLANFHIKGQDGVSPFKIGRPTLNILYIDPFGKIGVGTENPTQALSVSGNLFVQGGIYSDDTGFINLSEATQNWVTNERSSVYQTNGEGSAYPFDEQGHLILQSSSKESRDIIFATDSTTPQKRVVIKNDGRVGIGTESPAGNLHVISAGENTLVVTNNRMGVGVDDPSGIFAIAGSSGSEFMVVSNNTIAIGTTDPLDYTVRIKGTLMVDGRIYQPGGEEAGIFDDDWTQDEELAIIYNKGDKVGIGTSQPTGKLHIVSALNGEYDTFIVKEGKVAIGTENVVNYFHVDTPDLANNFVITENGYIGVGTATPKYNLDLVGTFNAQNISISGNSLAGFKKPEDGVMVVSNGVNWELMSITKARQAINLGSPDELIASNNRIGIGITNPQAKLHVTSNVGDIFLAHSSVSTQNIILKSNGRVGIGTQTPVGKFQIMNYVDDRNETCLTVTQNQIGIGTNIPQDLMHLKYSGATYSDYLGLRIENDYIGSDSNLPKSGIDLKVGNSRARIAAHMQQNTSYPTVADLKFYTGDNLDEDDLRMVIKHDGAVGFGTSEPSGDIHVISNGKNTLIVTNNRVGIGTKEPLGEFQIKYNDSNILIASANYLGIGIDNPTHALEVTDNVMFGNNALIITNNKVCMGGATDPEGYSLKVKGDVWIENLHSSLSGISDDDWTVAGVKIKAGKKEVEIGTSIDESSFYVQYTKDGQDYESLVVTNNKVGIGLKTPAATLQVKTQAGSDIPVLITNEDTDDIFFVVTRNGYVGIDKTNPSYPLDVNGIINATEILFAGDKVATQTPGSIELAKLATNNGNIIYAVDDHWAVASGNDARHVLNLGTQDSPTFSALAVNRANSDAADLHVGSNDALFVKSALDTNTGRVGIGTSVPSGSFHVRSHNNSGTFVNALVVTNNYVGIATKNPTYELTVNGDIYSNGSNYFTTLRYKDGSVIVDSNNLNLYKQITSNSIGSEDGQMLIYNYSGGYWEAKSNVTFRDTLNLATSDTVLFNGLGIGQSSLSNIKGDLHVLSDGSNGLVVTKNKVAIGLLDPVASLQIKPSPNVLPLKITSSNNDVFMVVNQLGYVGIGSATPEYALDVNGTINASSLLVDGAALATTSAGLRELADLSQDSSAIIVGDGTSWVAKTGNNARHELELGTEDKPRFTWLGLDRSTAPLGPIHIGDEGILVTKNGSIYQMGIYVDSPQANLHVSGNIPFIVSTTSTPNALVVTSNAFVGIGKANPDYLLDVNGTLNATTILLDGAAVPTNATALNMIGKLAKTDSNFMVGDGSSWVAESGNTARTSLGLGTSNSPTFNQIGAGTSFVGSPAGDLHIGVNTLVVTNNRVGISTTEPVGSLHIKTAKNDSPTTYLDTFVVTNNFVGIGNTTPTKELDVSGNVIVSGNINIQKSLNTGTGLRFTVKNTNATGESYSALILENHDNSIISQFYTDSNGTGAHGRAGTYFGNYTNSDIGIFTNNLERMTIEDDGDIGIGIVHPSARLHVTENFKISIKSTDNVFEVKDFGDDNIMVSVDGKILAKGVKIWSESDNDFIDVVADSESLSVLSGLAPADDQFLLGSASSQWVLKSGNDVRTALSLGNQQTPTFSAIGAGFETSQGATPSGDLHIGLKALVVTNNFVGIGTITPVGDLHIVNGSTDSLIVTDNKVGIGFSSPTAILHAKGSGAVFQTSTSGTSEIFLFREDANDSDKGKVYIGSDLSAQTDDTELNVDGDIMLAGDADEDISILFRNGSTNTDKAKINANNGKLTFSSNDTSSSHLVIDGKGSTAGFVGINTSSPKGDFQVDSDGNQYTMVITQNAVVIGGTNSANYKLRVIGNTSVSGNMVISQPQSNAGGTVLTLKNTNAIGSSYTVLKLLSHDSAINSKYYIDANGNANLGRSAVFFGNASAHDLGIFTDNTERITVEDDGDIGIGITNPLASLHVTGNTPLIVSVGSTPNALVVTSNAFVGIGKANPDYLLDVNGTLNVQTLFLKEKDLDNYYVPATINASWVKGYSDLTRTGTWDNNSTAGYNWGNPRFAATDSQTSIGSESAYFIISKPASDAHTAYMSLVKHNDGGYIDVYIKIGSNYRFQRRISTYQNIATSDSNDGSTIVLLATGLEGASDTGTIKVVVTKGSLRFTGLAFSTEYSVGDSGAEFVHWNNIWGNPFNSDDNLGLGTETPSGQIHVIDNSITSFIVTKNSIGIGLENPGASLNVSSNSQTYVAKFENHAGVAAGKGIYISGGTDADGEYEAISFYDGDGGQESFIGYKDGNIGINTTTPNKAFSVRGQVAISGNAYLTESLATSTGLRLSVKNTNATGKSYSSLVLEDHDNAIISTYYTDSNGSGVLGRAASYFGNYTNTDIGIFTNNLERMTIENDGDIGIGVTDNPVAALHVSGNSKVFQVSSTKKEELIVARADANDDSHGKVYIGGDFSTTSFDEELNVSGDMVLSKGGSQVVGLLFRGSQEDAAASAESASIKVDTGVMTLSAGGMSNSLMTIKKGYSSNGFVGINKSTPVADLHVASSGGNNSLVVTNNRVGINTQSPQGEFQVDSDGNSYSLVVTNNRVGIGVSAPTSTLNVSGNVALKMKTDVISAPTTLSDDYSVKVTGDVTITLPAVADVKSRIYVIKNVGVGTITIDANSSETIDATATKTLTAKYEAITLQSDGVEWWIISKYTP
jgi:hypothetical protein